MLRRRGSEDADDETEMGEERDNNEEMDEKDEEDETKAETDDRDAEGEIEGPKTRRRKLS